MKKLTTKAIKKAIEKIKRAEAKNPLVETKGGDLVCFQGLKFLRWNDLKPRPK